jgi:hypothetical protein
LVWYNGTNKKMKWSTIDIVVILLTGTVCLTLFLAVVGTMAAKIFNPQLDVKMASEIIGSNIGVITGALVGFLGGRSIGREEARNNEKK